MRRTVQLPVSNASLEKAHSPQQTHPVERRTVAGLRRGGRALRELGAGLTALALAAGCPSNGDGPGGKPNGIQGQTVDRVFARADKALDATSVHTVQLSDGRQVSDVHALHGGDDCTGRLTDDQGLAWHFTALGGGTWITPQRRSAKLADRTGAKPADCTGAPVEPGRYLPVETNSPGFAGTSAQRTIAACHPRFSVLKQQRFKVTKGRDPRERAVSSGGEG
ncbi:hypothetical protein OHB54_39770 [Streptomyces sp. NBC_01007]|nr:hypothetical protein OHB54_39770 [Streptomyces sp. NBC_01007]